MSPNGPVISSQASRELLYRSRRRERSQAPAIAFDADANGLGGMIGPVFSFATRLTRLTPALAAASPDTLLAKAGEAAPDWSGGTRIRAAVKEFNDVYGCRGMARGAVVLIISDGSEAGEPALLAALRAR